MENVISSAVLMIAFFIVFWQLSNVQRQLYDLRAKNAEVDVVLSTISKLIKEEFDQGTIREENTIRALNEICKSLNDFFQTNGAFMNHSTYSLVNIAACMIPFIDDIKECALEEDDYEKAQECMNIIDNLKKIINS